MGKGGDLGALGIIHSPSSKGLSVNPTFQPYLTIRPLTRLAILPLWQRG